jgi:aspartyl-tRNA(Asn)/glutamyl-tRNA(Gln) amidotransferase subunit C
MKLTAEEVEHIADLARLELTAEEKAKYSHQLSTILDYFDKLSEIDTNNTPPMSHPSSLENVLRADEACGSFPAEATLANAPDRTDSCFRVPVILEQ